jgi:hypothetical protein
MNTLNVAQTMVTGADAAATTPPPASAPPPRLFHPRMAGLVARVQSTAPLSAAELDVWAQRADEFEENVLAGVRRVFASDLVNEYLASRADEATRLRELRMLLDAAKADISNAVDARVRESDASQVRRLRSARASLVAASAIGFAMASVSTGDAMPDVRAVRGIETTAERDGLLQMLRDVRDALKAARPMNALTFAETCAIFVALVGQESTDALRRYLARAPTQGAPEPPTTSLPYLLSTYTPPPPALALYPALLAANLAGADPPSSNLPSLPPRPPPAAPRLQAMGVAVEADAPTSAFPLLGRWASANRLASANALNLFRATPLTLGRLALAEGLTSVATSTAFAGARPDTAPLTLEWLQAPSIFTVGTIERAATFTPPNWEVIVAMITAAIHRTYRMLDGAALAQLPSAAAGLIVSGQIASLDDALRESAANIVEIDELCDSFDIESIKLMCSMLREAGYARAVEDRQLVYATPAAWEEAGEARVALPGELADYVAQFGAQTASMALSTLFQLPVDARWTFDGDVAVRPLEPPAQRRAYAVARAFVLRNAATVAVVAGVSASIALGMWLAPSHGVHLASTISLRDATMLAATRSQDAATTIERLVDWTPVSPVIDVGGGTSVRFSISVPGVVPRAFDILTNTLATLRPLSEEEPLGAGDAVAVVQTEQGIEAVLSRVLTEVFVWLVTE